MKCPFCGSFDGQVLDSRPIEHTSAIRRRRQCNQCKKRYTTYERPEEVVLMVVKSDSRREPFDRKKVWNAVSRACVKRPVSAETIEKIVSDVETEITDYIIEVPSSVIGQKILQKLLDIDIVAYIRFVSVYNNFADIRVRYYQVNFNCEKEFKFTKELAGFIYNGFLAFTATVLDKNEDDESENWMPIFLIFELVDKMYILSSLDIIDKISLSFCLKKSSNVTKILLNGS